MEDVSRKRDDNPNGFEYSEQELKPWVEKVNEIREQTKILRIYFNNHYGGKAVINSMQFKEMIGI